MTMATILSQFICMVALGFSLAATYELDDTYCRSNSGSTFTTIIIFHNGIANVTYMGIKTYGTVCSINFKGGVGSDKDYELCVEALTFTITCSVTVDYFLFDSFAFSPNKTFTCNDTKPEKLCTNKRNFLIAIDASSQTSSEIVLKITAKDNKAKAPTGDVSGLKPTLLPLMLAGLFIVSKKLDCHYQCFWSIIIK